MVGVRRARPRRFEEDTDHDPGTEKIIRAKVGLLELARQLSGNVSQACKMMGYSRDSFYRFKESLTTLPAANWRCKKSRGASRS